MNVMRHLLTGPACETAREPVVPTVGLCRRSRPAGADRVVEFAPGEFVQIRAPVQSVVVQSVGGPLPPFAVPCHVLDERQDIELVILHDAPWLENSERLPERLQAFSPTGRAIVADQTLEEQLSQAGAHLWTDVLVDAPAQDLDVVVEALATILTGQLLACLDWADLRAVAGGRRGRPGRGRAIVVNGVGDERVAATLNDELSRLAGEGFNGGILLMQLVTPQDEALLTLERLDRFAANFRMGAGERDLILTASTIASRNAVAVVAFRPVGNRPR